LPDNEEQKTKKDKTTVKADLSGFAALAGKSHGHILFTIKFSIFSFYGYSIGRGINKGYTKEKGLL
jgi:hypothetical protein